MKPRYVNARWSPFSGAPMLTPTPMACHTGDDRSRSGAFGCSLLMKGLSRKGHDLCARSLEDMPSLMGS